MIEVEERKQRNKEEGISFRKKYKKTPKSVGKKLQSFLFTVCSNFPNN